MKRGVAATIALLAAALAFGAGSARADSVPIANDGNLPWASGATNHSPLEVFASSLAHQLSGRPQLDPIEVRCEGQTDWTNLGQTSNELGYVQFFYSYSFQDGFTLEPGNLIELSPDV